MVLVGDKGLKAQVSQGLLSVAQMGAKMLWLVRVAAKGEKGAS